MTCHNEESVEWTGMNTWEAENNPRLDERGIGL